MARLESILDHLPTPLLLLDTEAQRFTFSNRAARERHATLRSEIDGGAGHAVRQRHVYGFVDTIDDWLSQLGALRRWSSEEPDIFDREVWIETGDENGRADDFRITRRVMFQRIARRRNVRRVEFERFGAFNQRARRGRLARQFRWEKGRSEHEDWDEVGARHGGGGGTG